jgi:BirA family transcriptional regulator, biotin operon repressor / biotin---[acetyl-CoA-carboxylase] ligase
MKKNVLNELKSNMSKYVSGEELSKALGVSRTAVWKYINEFKKEGYDIVSSSKKGYKLVSIPDIISVNEISYNLATEVLGRNIVYFDTIDSTNSYAKKLGNANCVEGTVVVADMQTEGRGRLGRQWNSASGKGIWMSIVLKPNIGPEDAQIITIAAAIAVVAALKKSVGIDAGIKWPNDIIIDGKKVCGILTEMNSEMERVNFIVLGIGLNVNQTAEDFPEDIKDLATSLKIHLNKGTDRGNSSPDLLNCTSQVNRPPDSLDFNRCEIIKNLLYELERIYSKISKGFITEIIDEWKRHSITLGKDVRIISKSTNFTGVAINITKDGKLVVKCDDGEVREVISGEVSVRGILGVR